MTEEAYEIYDELARGGVGAIITGFTSVALHDYYFGGMMRLCDDALLPQYKKLTDLIHAQGCPVITQLALGAYYREVRGRFLQVEPDYMSLEEIRLVVSQFIEAAVRAEKAGFDGVQIHAEHRSSFPLDIAYKAAQLTDPGKADLYLKNLQLATIVETRQTTLPEELLSIAVETGIDPAAFGRHFEDGSAEAAFRADLQFTRSLGIYSLPTFLLQYREQAMLIGQLIGFEDFKRAIQRLTGE